jgi:hypothetical protein
MGQTEPVCRVGGDRGEPGLDGLRAQYGRLVHNQLLIGVERDLLPGTARGPICNVRRRTVYSRHVIARHLASGVLDE